MKQDESLESPKTYWTPACLPIVSEAVFNAIASQQKLGLLGLDVGSMQWLVQNNPLLGRALEELTQSMVNRMVHGLSTKPGLRPRDIVAWTLELSLMLLRLIDDALKEKTELILPNRP